VSSAESAQDLLMAEKEPKRNHNLLWAAGIIVAFLVGIELLD